jgi:putative transposase
MDDAGEALRALRSLATSPESNYPDAAASLREGLEETVTVLRLQISGLPFNECY